MVSLPPNPAVETPQVPPEQTGEPARTLTIAEVAALLRVTDKTIRRWLKAGHVRGVQPAGRKSAWRIPSTEVERLLRTQPEAE